MDALALLEIHSLSRTDSRQLVDVGTPLIKFGFFLLERILPFSRSLFLLRL
jgi:hypothetical protein